MLNTETRSELLLKKRWHISDRNLQKRDIHKSKYIYKKKLWQRRESNVTVFIRPYPQHWHCRPKQWAQWAQWCLHYLQLHEQAPIHSEYRKHKRTTAQRGCIQRPREEGKAMSVNGTQNLRLLKSSQMQITRTAERWTKTKRKHTLERNNR